MKIIGSLTRARTWDLRINSPQAWRYLHICAIDPQAFRLRRYPIEVLGALSHRYG
ncbi:hypothetical protein [Nitrosomonas aestuarii]|uniref:hypothetical protein n=1 Tax=Nitrosomonas aestuarii TaxID=52441 RepID=UPI001C62715C|nr:hypothetical protein [Nitrosomonas aestuarii]